MPDEENNKKKSTAIVPSRKRKKAFLTLASATVSAGLGYLAVLFGGATTTGALVVAAMQGAIKLIKPLWNAVKPNESKSNDTAEEHSRNDKLLSSIADSLAQINESLRILVQLILVFGLAYAAFTLVDILITHIGWIGNVVAGVLLVLFISAVSDDDESTDN